MGDETAAQLRQDVILGLGFLALTVATLRRLRACAGQAGLQTVIMTFYSLILFTSLIRAVWFLVPTSVLQESYAPTAEYAFEGDWWLRTYIWEVLSVLGSLTLFGIFILITIFWADLLQKIFKDSLRPSRPMASFTTVVACLAAAEALNSCLFLVRIYSSQGMILFDSLLLTTLSLVYSVEISRFSHRYRTVLRTLGDINQVSTETQVTLIGRTTVAANVFFAVQAACELTVGMVIYLYYKRHGTFDLDFSTRMWDWYMLIKHSSEWLILSLMLWMLHVPRGEQPPPSYYSEGDALDGEDEEEAPRETGDAMSSAGENDYWDRPGSHAGYGVGSTGSQPLNPDGRRVDEYGSI